MKIKNAYYPRALPTAILIVLPDGRHYAAALSPSRHIKESELRPLRGYDMTRPERFWDKYDMVPDYALRFYGLER